MCVNCPVGLNTDDTIPKVSILALRKSGTTGGAKPATLLQVRRATSAHDFAIPGLDMEMWQTGPAQQLSWSITEARLSDTALLSGQMAAPYAASIAAQAATVFVLQDGGPWLINGCVVNAGELSLFAPAADVDVASMGPCTWYAIRTSTELLQRYTMAFSGKPLSTRSGVTTLGRLEAPQLEGLQSTLATLASQAHPKIRQGALGSIQRQLLLLVTTAANEGGVGLHTGYERIARQAMEYLREHKDDSICTADLCLALGVSERWLRKSFLRVYGVSAMRLLRLRRLHLARRTLLENATSVTEVATSHGFFDLGRFSTSYRALFGESPSTTLSYKAPSAPSSSGRKAATARRP